jgi:5'-methylthioadenosine phosphorylase
MEHLSIDEEYKGEVDFVVIGGSGFYNMDGMEVIEKIMIQTPHFGRHMIPLVVGKLQGKNVAFCARHGSGHYLPPHTVPQKSIIWAIKKVKAKAAVTVSAVGSLKENVGKGQILLLDQYVDLTRRRSTFFEDVGISAHVSMAEPVCKHLRKQAFESVADSSLPVLKSGTVVCIEGPQFSSRAESNVFRSMYPGAEVIGMTTSVELKYLREAELCALAIAHVTDYDSWRFGKTPVSANEVSRVSSQNIVLVQQVISAFAEKFDPKRVCACHSALKDAIQTKPFELQKNIALEEYRGSYSKLKMFLGDYLPDPNSIPTNYASVVKTTE